jgi:leucyl-tRNA synthetase
MCIRDSFQASWPEWNPAYLIENEFEYPVSVNGKLRFKELLPLDWSVAQIENHIRQHESLAKYTEGKPIKKWVIVPGKIINVVV